MSLCQRVFFFLLLGLLVWAGVVSPPPAAAQSELTLSASPQLFTILAALRAAGVDPGGAAAADPILVQVDAALAQADPETLARLREFWQAQPSSDPQRMLNHFISLALVLGPPPQFEFMLPRSALPPGAYELQEFQSLAADFYRRGGVARLLQSVAPGYERAVAERSGEVTDLLQETRAYLRLASETYPARSYTIYLEWLVPRHLVSARNYGEHYFLVVHPQCAEFGDAIRHQYLHYLLDPVVLKHTSALRPWRRLHMVAARAPRLPQPFREDLTLLATESLIQAVEVRLRHLDGPAELVEIERLERDGYVFVRHFRTALLRFEQSSPSIRYYVPDLLVGLNVEREEARLARVEFAAREASSRSTHTEPLPRAFRRLVEGERLLQQGDIVGAREQFEKVLQEADPNEPRALYGLAIVHSHEQDRERAKYYFLRTLEVARQPNLLAWAHVYLGRLYDLEGEREQALGHYRAALAVVPRMERVEQAARRGLERAFGDDEEWEDQEPN